jgi:UDP-N-acetylmuramoyl-L-alanine---L-glutamate ligase
MRIADLADARVAIWGFAREGRASLAMLRERFPHKLLTVFCNEREAAELRKSSAATSTEIITTAADANALSRFDVVIKSPGISAYKSPYPQAVEAGVRFTSGTALWFAEHPEAKTICVTGTKGKSTVAALIAHLLRKSGQCVALAGNIGMPMLELLDPPRLPAWWVIELSSFQTRDFDGAPTVAVVNNLYQEHLDWHESLQNYVADKLKIVARAESVVVAAQPDLIAATSHCAKRSVIGNDDGWHVRGDAIFSGSTRVLDLDLIPLPGFHNAQNVCAALAALDAAGENAIALAQHVSSFKPLPHRLQLLGERDGLGYVNDSISTTPYASVEALRSLSTGDVTILVGGFDRGVDWRIFVDYVATHPPQGIVTMGANGDAIARALDGRNVVARRSGSLAEAVRNAQTMTPRGGTIVLSPGAPSFDQFRDYAQRGREFARLAGFDPDSIAQIEGMGIS